MKKIFILFISLLAVDVSFAQILNPVKFSYTAVKKSSTLFEVHVKAIVDPTWHIYSVYNPDGGAVPTSLTFTNAQTVGKAKESGKLKTVYEDAFKLNQKYYENSVDFIQTVKVQPGAKKVTGKLEYMVCNDHQCLPPKTVPFEIAL
ncbi:MAG TPA: protein-disulfide reductase DsbD domain-containing protein [Chitinophagaceae bacterium]|nr:protein-disulfide reductase DsbD domain-containing protein [Chitinophagaceae bacterium]